MNNNIFIGGEKKAWGLRSCYFFIGLKSSVLFTSQMIEMKFPRIAGNGKFRVPALVIEK